MARQPDQAFLFFASDWLTDEKVVLLSPAAKGTYIDLLCHCWVEGSLPACSEHLARIARIDAQQFAELWRELVGLFIEHPELPGRLTNKRIERERQIANERAKARSDKAKRAAAKRWGSHATSNARSTAPSNAPSIDRAMPRDAKAKAKAVLPLPPREEAADQPTRSRASRGGASASRRGDPEPERATRAPESLRPEPAPSVQPPDDRAAAEAVPIAAGDSDEVLQLQAALMQSRYRSSMVPMRRRFAMRREAERLVATGLDVPQLEQLAELALERTNDDPGALLAHWLDGEPPRWREVLDEQAAKGRQVAARCRTAEPGEPLAAASVIDSVLMGARGIA